MAEVSSGKVCETSTPTAGAFSSEGGASDVGFSFDAGERHGGVTPTVSVVATFFNIEELYLRRCVECLLNQSDREFELLLVDDGSTDGKTPAMLDEYDGREGVRVLHKENGGPGDARNYGARMASGEYVSFVDGDDFVSPHYVSLLRRAQRETGADLVVGVHKIVSSGLDPRDFSWNQDFEVRLLSRDEAVHALLLEEVNEAPWCKLAPRSLYLAHPFPCGVYYEDVAIAGEHYLASPRVAQVATPIYGYVMRVGSVVHRRTAKIKQALDFERAIDDFLDPIRDAYPNLKREIAYRDALELARLHSVLHAVSDDKSAVAAMDKRVIGALREDLRIISTASSTGNYMAASDELVTSDGSATSDVKGRGGLPRSNLLRFRLLSFLPGLYDTLFAWFEALKKNVRRK